MRITAGMVGMLWLGVAGAETVHCGGGPLDPVYSGPVAEAQCETFKAVTVTRRDPKLKQQYLRRALELASAAVGGDAIELEPFLLNLADSLGTTGAYPEAEALIDRALKIANGNADREWVNKVFCGAGHLKKRQGLLSAAEALYTQGGCALALVELAPVTGHLEGIDAYWKDAEKDGLEQVMLLQRGQMAQLRQQPKEAKRFYKTFLDTVAIKDSELAIRAYEGLAAADLQAKEPGAALASLGTAVRMADRYVHEVLIQGRGNDWSEQGFTEDKALWYLRNAYFDLFGQLDRVVSFQQQTSPADPAALQLALNTILRRKGMLLDAATSQTRKVREHLAPDQRESWRELRRLRAAVSVRSAQGKSGDELVDMTKRADAIEETLTRSMADLPDERGEVTIEAIQQRIPDDSVLIEIVLYRPFRADARRLPDQWGESRYAAYVLGHRGPAQAFDLGPAAKIDALVESWRRALKSGSLEASRWGRELYALIFSPLKGALVGRSHLLLAPDGALNLIPPAALQDGHGRYLIESYLITCLTSGRDLLRLSESRPNGAGAPMALADPAFGSSNDLYPAGVRSGDLHAQRWSQLPGTRGEAARFGTVFPSAQVLLDAQATEEAVKAAVGPAILHLATHGFFLSGTAESGPGTSRGVGRLPATGKTTQAELPEPGEENPLLRSGLVLAQPPRGSGAVEDGILTALEVTDLELDGTDLVVLSACDTGLGELHSGEGVYGLRRAFVIAGVRTVVFSLWQVDDEATGDLMQQFYSYLKSGVPRGEALRRAQLQLLHSPRTAAPYYWAAFVESGEWSAVSPVKLGEVPAERRTTTTSGTAPRPRIEELRPFAEPKKDFAWQISDDRLFAVSTDGRVDRVDLQTGKATWSHVTGVYAPKVAASDDVLVYTGGCALTAVDVQTGRQLWRVDGRGEPFESCWGSRPLINGGVVFWGTDHAMNATDLATGAPRWRVAVDCMPATQLLFADGRLVFGTLKQVPIPGVANTGSIYALDVATGKPTWLRAVDGGVTEVFPGDPKQVLARSSLQSRVGAFDLTDGSAQWSYAPTVLLGDEVTPGWADGVLYLNERSHINAVDARTGRVLWRYAFDHPLYMPLVVGGALYFGNWTFGAEPESSTLVRYDTVSGEVTSWPVKGLTWGAPFRCGGGACFPLSDGRLMRVE